MINGGSLQGSGDMDTQWLYNQNITLTCLANGQIEGSSDNGNNVITCLDSGRWGYGDIACLGMCVA